MAEWLRPEDWEGPIQSASTILVLCVNSSRAVGSFLSVPSDYTTLAKLSTILTNARNQLAGKSDSRAVGFLPGERDPKASWEEFLMIQFLMIQFLMIQNKM